MEPERDIESGELVDVVEMEAHAVAEYRVSRKMVSALPTRISRRSCLSREQTEIVVGEVRAVLNEMAHADHPKPLPSSGGNQADVQIWRSA
jgi:hypothetical protein